MNLKIRALLVMVVGSSALSSCGGGGSWADLEGSKAERESALACGIGEYFDDVTLAEPEEPLDEDDAEHRDHALVELRLELTLLMAAAANDEAYAHVGKNAARIFTGAELGHYLASFSEEFASILEQCDDSMDLPDNRSERLDIYLDYACGAATELVGTQPPVRKGSVEAAEAWAVMTAAEVGYDVAEETELTDTLVDFAGNLIAAPRTKEFKQRIAADAANVEELCGER